MEVRLSETEPDAIELDGQRIVTEFIPLVDDSRRHQARVVRVRRG